MKCWLLLAALLAACSAPEQTALPAESVVLVLGDSLSYGTGARRGEDYPSLLAESTGWNIINAGVPGDTTAGGLQRLPDLLEEHEPDLLLVELGGNDFLRRLPARETEANLRAILTQAQQEGVPALLLAVPTPSLLGASVTGLADDPLYERIAEETGTPLIREVLSEVLSDEELKADTVHANAEGYRQIAERLHDALRDMGLSAD